MARVLLCVRTSNCNYTAKYNLKFIIFNLLWEEGKIQMKKSMQYKFHKICKGHLLLEFSSSVCRVQKQDIEISIALESSRSFRDISNLVFKYWDINPLKLSTQWKYVFFITQTNLRSSWIFSSLHFSPMNKYWS